MDVIESGISMVKIREPAQKSAEIVVTESGITTDVIPTCKKAWVSIFATVPGITKDVKLQQFTKA